jgi:ribose 5-phosphate isomerase A
LKPNQTPAETAKLNAALEAVKHVKNRTVVGLGSGSTAALAIKALGERAKHENLTILAIPSSYQAFQLAVEWKIPITTLEEHPIIDVTIDGADQITPELNLIKGNGAAQTREKIVAAATKQNIIIADETKKVKILGENNQPVPIEALPFALGLVKRKIEELNGKVTLRETKGKAGPIISDNGNIILDANFGTIPNPAELQTQLKTIPGIIETGHFIGLTDIAYIGTPTGTEKIETKRKH